MMHFHELKTYQVQCHKQYTLVTSYKSILFRAQLTQLNVFDTYFDMKSTLNHITHNDLILQLKLLDSNMIYKTTHPRIGDPNVT